MVDRIRHRSAIAELLRRVERRLYANALHSRADTLTNRRLEPWNLAAFAGHRYCLLVTYRQDGTPVPTPVWFAPVCAT
jgi:hypothetical protein